MKILFLTQNQASFRMDWLDQIALYADVKVFHLNEYEPGVNSKFVSSTPNKVVCEDVSIKLFGKKFYNPYKIFKETYDVLILDGYGFLGQQSIILLLKLVNKRFIMSIDGGFIKAHENPIRRSMKTFLISSADAFLSTGEKTDEFIRFYNKKGKSACIYRHKFSSIHLDEIGRVLNRNEKLLARKKMHIKDKFTIVCVGRIIPIKGFDIAIQTLNYLPDDVQICIVGDGDENLLKTYISSEREEQVIFLGHIERKQIADVYRCADVFVLPTRGDVWGLVIAEAMANGLPVVTTDTCLAGCEMIKNGENGYIVPVDDSNALAKAIEYIYRDPVLKNKMGQKNIELVCEYAIENAAKEDMKNILSWKGILK